MQNLIFYNLIQIYEYEHWADIHKFTIHMEL